MLKTTEKYNIINIYIHRNSLYFCYKFFSQQFMTVKIVKDRSFTKIINGSK